MSTFLQLYTRVLAAADLPLTSGTSDATEAKDLVNNAYYEICSRAKLNQKSVTKTLTAGTADYGISTTSPTSPNLSINDLQAIRSLTYTLAGQTQAYAVEPTTVDEILRLRQAASSTSTGTLMKYALLGLDTLMLWGTPATADSLGIYYAFRPTAMSADSDTPTVLPAEFHDLIVVGALKAALRTSDLSAAAAYHREFEAGLAELGSWLSGRLAGRPRRMTVGRRRPLVYGRNDIYISGMD